MPCAVCDLVNFRYITGLNNCHSFTGIVFKPEEDVYLKPKRIVEKKKKDKCTGHEKVTPENESDVEDEEVAHGIEQGSLSNVYA